MKHVAEIDDNNEFLTGLFVFLENNLKGGWKCSNLRIQKEIFALLL